MALEMKFSEFIALKREQQLSILMDYWHLETPYVRCKVKINGEADEKNIAKIRVYEIKHPYSEQPLLNPFNGTKLEKVFKINVKNNKIAAMSGKEVMVKFSVMNSLFAYNMTVTESNFLEIDKQDVFSLLELEDIFKESNTKDFEDFLKGFFSGRRVVFAEEVKTRISSLKDEYEDYVEVSRKLEEEINSKKIDIHVLSKELSSSALKKQEQERMLEKLSEQAAEKKTEFRKLSEQLSIAKEEYGNYTKELEMLKKLGFYKKEASADKPKVETYEVKDEAAYIQSYLQYKHPKRLYYDYHLVNCFYGALKTNQLIMLCGEPGTGKTSLVSGVAEALGADLLVMPVQPDWSSHEDLLGFYNPVDKAYVSTPFLDKLIEAEENPEKLFIICLDEMNLAHVEYYFNDFLSALQSKEPLMLYSENLEQLEKEEIGSHLFGLSREVSDKEISHWFNNAENKSREQYLTLRRRWNMLNRYRAKLVIPSNVRFVGTINIDETTKDISPKVVDRSFMIKVRKSEESIAPEEMSEYRVLNVKPSKMKPSEENTNIPAGVFNDIEGIIEHLNKIKEGFEEGFNYRFQSQVRELSGIFNNDSLFDNILFGKVFPKMKFIIESEYREQVLENMNAIESIMKSYECKLSGTLFEKLKKRFESETEERISGELNYWS